MLPKIVQPYLWFSDLKKIDPQRDKKRIILNILNLGSRKATDWLFDFYEKAEIRRTLINHGAKGELSEKSLNYWNLVLNIDPKKIIKSRL